MASRAAKWTYGLWVTDDVKAKRAVRVTEQERTTLRKCALEGAVEVATERARKGGRSLPSPIASHRHPSAA